MGTCTYCQYKAKDDYFDTPNYNQYFSTNRMSKRSYIDIPEIIREEDENEYTDYIKSDRNKILDYSHAIIKLQALFRGYLVRKKLHNNNNKQINESSVINIEAKVYQSHREISSYREDSANVTLNKEIIYLDNSRYNGKLLKRRNKKSGTKWVWNSRLARWIKIRGILG